MRDDACREFSVSVRRSELRAKKARLDKLLWALDIWVEFVLEKALMQ